MTQRIDTSRLAEALPDSITDDEMSRVCAITQERIAADPDNEYAGLVFKLLLHHCQTLENLSRLHLQRSGLTVERMIMP